MNEQQHTAALCLFLPIVFERAYQICLNLVDTDISWRRNTVAPWAAVGRAAKGAAALAFYGFFKLKLGS